MKLYSTLLAVPIVGFLASQSGCDAPQNTKYEQAQKAAEVAANIKFTDNAEINNIKKRIELTANPGAIGFIVLMNQAGQPILYTSVRGKVSSSSKRLTTPDRMYCNSTHCAIRTAPSDEGTWGSSDSYIYFWTTDGQYMQWSGNYLYSDKPFRIRVEPLVINQVTEGK